MMRYNLNLTGKIRLKFLALIIAFSCIYALIFAFSGKPQGLRNIKFQIPSVLCYNVKIVVLSIETLKRALIEIHILTFNCVWHLALKICCIEKLQGDCL